jgi:hypothetical protein
MSVLHVHGSHTPVRRIGLIVIVAVVIAFAGLGGWLEFRSHASDVSPTGGIVDPAQIMLNGKELPAQQMNDLSVIFD